MSKPIPTLADRRREYEAASAMLAALHSAVASFDLLVKLNRIPENFKGRRDALAAIAQAETAGIKVSS